MTERLTGRTVSGDIALDDVSAQNYRFTSISGDIRLKLKSAFDLMEVRTVSGDCSIVTDAEKISVSMRSVSGHKAADGVELTEEQGVPAVRVTSVSGDVKIIGVRKV